MSGVPLPLSLPQLPPPCLPPAKHWPAVLALLLLLLALLLLLLLHPPGVSCTR